MQKHSEKQNMKRLLSVIIMLAMIAALPGCAGGRGQDSPPYPEAEITAKAAGTASADDTVLPSEPANTEGSVKEAVKEKMLVMMIGDAAVEVEWENNDSAEALKALCENGPLVIGMSMYGGFEQVGPIGTRLPSNDVQTKTSAGDIVLYSSDRLVVFYGSNSWSYTRLGHIADRDAAGMEALLGHGGVTITLSLKDAE